jgi:hypothetical protein
MVCRHYADASLEVNKTALIQGPYQASMGKDVLDPPAPEIEQRPRR